MLFGSRPARLAILGPGGYGKTTLASAVLAHRRVRQRFGDARYFVACESATTSGDLLVELGKALGLTEVGLDAPWSYIKTTLTEKECIICLDNFESPWDQAAETRNSAEELLSKITSLRGVTVLVTMRGIERPARTHWTQPALAPLKTLDSHSAKVAWQLIVNNFDSYAEQLITAVDCVPLAVSILAHLAQATSPMLLWKEWNEKYTGLVQRGSHKLSNLDFSIQLSLDSQRMRDNPAARELLGVLSMLPDGIHMKLLDKFKDLLGMDILSCLRVLQQCSLIEVTAEKYQSHSLIRYFCHSQGLLLPRHEELLNGHYISLAMINRYQADSDDYPEMVLEANNTKSTLSRLLKSNYWDQSTLVDAVLSFVNFSMNMGDYSGQLLDEATKFIQQNDLSISLQIGCLQRWGRLYYRTHDLEKAKLKLLEAKLLCLSSSNHDNVLHAKILRDLGDIHLDQGDTSDAEAVFQDALKLYMAADDSLGQGNCYSKLGGIYIKLKKLQEAEAAYNQALKFHMSLDDNVGRGSDYRGLGDIQLQQKRFNDAEAFYQRALEFDKAANSTRGQAKDYKALGNTHQKNKELDNASAFFEKALELYKALGSSSGQGNIYYDLAKIYLKRSQLKEAKTKIKMALYMHKQAQDEAGEKQDEKLLNQILSKDGAVTNEK